MKKIYVVTVAKIPSLSLLMALACSVWFFFIIDGVSVFALVLFHC